MAKVIHAEARGESAVGQLAVGQVLYNRAKRTNKSICYWARSKAFAASGKADKFHYWLSQQILLRRLPDPTFGAQFFSRRRNSVAGAVTIRIGHHVFQKDKLNDENIRKGNQRLYLSSK